MFGRDVVYSPRVSPNACTWLPLGDYGWDLLTGGQLAISGTTPCVCARAVCTTEARRLLNDVGLQIAEELYQYRDGSDYLQVLDRLCKHGKRIALQHVHSATDIPPENCWVAPSILSFVNNKACYRDIVDETYLPPRTIIHSRRMSEKLSSSPLPMVIKAATEESTGGGFDVFICRAKHDLREAERLFQSCSRVVAEEFFEIHRNLCLNYAVTATGRIYYLGSAEQVSNTEGKYQGNWIDSQAEAPPEAIELGRDIVRTGFGYGYWGFVGIDMAVQDDGRIIVFDLNFRINGSTCALVLADAVRHHLGQAVMRSCTLVGKGSYGEALEGVYKAMERKLLVPTASCDPAAGGYSAVPRIQCLILGQTREEVAENQRQIAEWGFSL